MNENYPSSSLIVRNLAELRHPYDVLDTVGRFRIVQIAAPYFEGYEFWIVNELGFLWEPADDLDAAFAYLESDEARAYNADSPRE